MRIFKWILIVILAIGILSINVILAFKAHAYLFDTLLESRRNDIKAICQETIEENPIVYYQDGSGLPKVSD